MPDYEINLPHFNFDEKTDLEKFKFWVLDKTHSGDGATPFFMWCWMIDYVGLGTQKGAEILSVPTTRGMDWRTKNGAFYMRTLAVMDEEEQKKREKLYRERIRPFIEDIDKVWEEEYKEKLFGMYERFYAVDLAVLSDIELLKLWEELVRPIHQFSAECHFVFGYPFFSVPRIFWDGCKEFGIEPYDPLSMALLQGVGNKLVECDMKIWNLSRRVKDLGLTDIFDNSTNSEEIKRKLSESANGKMWLKELDEFLSEYGYRMVKIFEVDTPSWFEDQTTVFNQIKIDLSLDDSEDPALRLEEQIAKRQAAEKEFFERIPEDKKAYMEVLLRAAQKCSRWCDEHDFYLDMQTWTILRLWAMEVGRRFVKSGSIDQTDDIFLFVPEEILKMFICASYYDLRNIVKERRAVYEENRRRIQEEEGYLPPALASPDVGMEEIGRITFMDGILASLGITEPPLEHEGIEYDMAGNPGSPGEGEGTVRIVLTDKDLLKVKKGDIVVTPLMLATWSMVFPLINGLVVEAGGILNHGSILGREYGKPVVVNILEGTKKLKEGQRIKIDGSKGLIWFLDK